MFSDLMLRNQEFTLELAGTSLVEFLRFAAVALSRSLQTSPKIQCVNDSKTSKTHPPLADFHSLEDQQSCSYATEWVATLEGSTRWTRDSSITYQPEACWTYTAWDFFAFVHQSVENSGFWQNLQISKSNHAEKIQVFGQAK